MYIELATRISTQALKDDEGILREALSSLHDLFPITREILKRHGPTVARKKERRGNPQLRRARCVRLELRGPTRASEVASPSREPRGNSPGGEICRRARGCMGTRSRAARRSRGPPGRSPSVCKPAGRGSGRFAPDRSRRSSERRHLSSRSVASVTGATEADHCPTAATPARTPPRPRRGAIAYLSRRWCQAMARASSLSVKVRRSGGGAWARSRGGVCPRTPRLTSALDPGWLRVGGMMFDGVFRQMVLRPLTPGRPRRRGGGGSAAILPGADRGSSGVVGLCRVTGVQATGAIASSPRFLSR